MCPEEGLEPLWARDPRPGRDAWPRGGSVSASVVGSGHGETQPWSQALRGDVGSARQRGLSQQPPDLHTLCPPRGGCGGRPRPQARVPTLGLWASGVVSAHLSCSVTHDGDTEAWLLGLAAPESCPTSAWTSSDTEAPRVTPGVYTRGHPPLLALTPALQRPPRPCPGSA